MWFKRKQSEESKLAEISRLTADIKQLQDARLIALQYDDFEEVNIIQRNIISANQVLAHLLDDLMPDNDTRKDKL